MVCPRSNFMGKELPRLFYLQSCCLQPGMDHADEWCEATNRRSYTPDSDADAHTHTHTHAAPSHAHANAGRLCAGDGLQCERMVQAALAGLVPSECCRLPTTLLQAGFRDGRGDHPSQRQRLWWIQTHRQDRRLLA